MFETNIACMPDELNGNILCIRIGTPLKMERDELVKSIRKACRSYVQTPEGKETLEYNCGNFNWGDFVTHVPERICTEHGFIILDSDESAVRVDHDECLVPAQ